jgi:hypothetical protein
MEAILDYIAVIAIILVIVCVCIMGFYGCVICPTANKMLSSNKHHIIWRAVENSQYKDRYEVRYMVNEDELNWFERLFADNDWTYIDQPIDGVEFKSKEEFDRFASKFPTMKEINENEPNLSNPRNVWLWP